jgi:hypothetical protein
MKNQADEEYSAGFLSAMEMSLSNASIKLPKSTQNIPASAIQSFTYLTIEVGSKELSWRGR